MSDKNERNSARPRGDATRAIHEGLPERRLGEPTSISPALASSFYTHPDAVGFSSKELGEESPYFYSRWGNPTLRSLEQRLASLERAEDAVVFATGMAAFNALAGGLLEAGDHLLVANIAYPGVTEFATTILKRQGVEASFVDPSDLDEVRAAIRPNTRLFHVETPANPILRLVDIAAIAEITRERGVKLSVDSTIATPLGIRPLEQGADFVIHSLSKYLSGHGDALGGAILGERAALASIRKEQLIRMGGTLSPFSAFLILRGLETLVPRMRLHEENARAVEAFLAAHPKVRRVLWPGSERHPQRELAERTMRSFSGLLSFSVHGDSAEMARQIANRVEVFSYAVSLGKTKSLIFYIPTEPILRDSFSLDEASEAMYRDWAGEGVFRVSVGLEDADDLIDDLSQALG